MREILFRAKRTDNGKWIYGYYAVIGERHVIIKAQSEDYYSVDDSVKKSHGNEVIEVKPETVCQYTGMTDKNGNKIFENDIVESYIEYDDFRNKREKGILRYTYGMYEIQIEEHEGKPVYTDFMAGISLSGCPFEMKVIGNIFDNPELIEH